MATPGRMVAPQHSEPGSRQAAGREGREGSSLPVTLQQPLGPAPISLAVMVHLGPRVRPAIRHSIAPGLPVGGLAVALAPQGPLLHLAATAPSMLVAHHLRRRAALQLAKMALLAGRAQRQAR